MFQSELLLTHILPGIFQKEEDKSHEMKWHEITNAPSDIFYPIVHNISRKRNFLLLKDH